MYVCNVYRAALRYLRYDYGAEMSTNSELAIVITYFGKVSPTAYIFTSSISKRIPWPKADLSFRVP